MIWCVVLVLMMVLGDVLIMWCSSLLLGVVVMDDGLRCGGYELLLLLLILCR